MMDDSFARDENCRVNPAEQPSDRPEMEASRYDYYAASKQAIAVGWFYLANLVTIAVFAAPSGAVPYPWGLASNGFYFQIATLGIWLGVGSSPLWKRCLVFALSHYVVRFYFRSHGEDSSGTFLVATWILGIAMMIAGVRAVICLMKRKWVTRRFSLAELFGATAAAGITMAVWIGPLRQFLQEGNSLQDIFESLFISMHYYDAYVVIIALPMLFCERTSRWRAFYVSLVLLLLYVCLAIVMSYRLGDGAVDELVEMGPYIVALMLLIVVTIYSAEIALAWWKIDLVRPVDREEPVDASRHVESDPLSMATESPQ